MEEWTKFMPEYVIFEKQIEIDLLIIHDFVARMTISAI